MKLRVEVTDEDRYFGEKLDAEKCAVARACQRVGLYGSVDGSGPKEDPWSRPTFDGYFNGHHIELQLPVEAGRFAEAFDREEHPDLIAFEVELEDELLTKAEDCP